MENKSYMPEPWLFPVVEHWGTRYVVDLKVGHFGQLSSPFEVIRFGADWGKGMCVAVGVVRCSSCGICVVHNGVGVCCVRCGKGGRGEGAARGRFGAKGRAN